MDVTAVEQMRSYFERLRERGTPVVLAKAQLPPRQAVMRLGWKDVHSEEGYYVKLSEAVSAFERSL
jgi:hypothetical protein